jgi:hypothetical protein
MYTHMKQTQATAARPQDKKTTRMASSEADPFLLFVEMGVSFASSEASAIPLIETSLPPRLGGWGF